MRAAAVVAIGLLVGCGTDSRPRVSPQALAGDFGPPMLDMSIPPPGDFGMPMPDMTMPPPPDLGPPTCNNPEWCTDIDCRQGDAVLGVSNPDGDPAIDSLLMSELPGNALDNCADPDTRMCGNDYVDIDGVQCNAACLETNSCSGFLPVPQHHEPDNCYGSCGVSCRACCHDYTTYCRPATFEAATTLAGCVKVAGGGAGIQRYTCGKTAQGYFNVSQSLVAAGMPAAANRRRGRTQSAASPGACPAYDWTPAVPRSFLTPAGVETFTRDPGAAAPPGTVTYNWVAINRAAKACSTTLPCYRHDECNRHDHTVDPRCQIWGLNNAGATALVGTPSVGFDYGWWFTAGTFRVDQGGGYQFGQAPEAANLLPEASGDAKLDCFYDVTVATGAVAGPLVNPPANFLGLQHRPGPAGAREQVTCPIHAVYH